MHLTRTGVLVADSSNVYIHHAADSTGPVSDWKPVTHRPSTSVSATECENYEGKQRAIRRHSHKCVRVLGGKGVMEKRDRGVEK